MKRRTFLKTLSAGAAGATLPLTALLSARRAHAAGHGALVPDPKGIFDLPAGFSYRVLHRTGDTMSDGYRMPGLPDGMACFPGAAGTVVLMCNHELVPGDSRGPYGSGQSAPPEAYDKVALGGVTRMVLKADTFELVSSNLVLTGTSRNCAGGTSPWGWLSCEETTATNHGYVFVCPTDADKVAPAKRIVGYGRFNHEAATVDPATNICYLTEDQFGSAFYRFVPDQKDQPFVGKLQALVIDGLNNANMSTALKVGDAPVKVNWVDIDEPDPPKDTVRTEAKSKGAALFARGEGLWHDPTTSSVTICATSGGRMLGGQIFRLHLGQSGAADTIELLAESTDRSKLDMPDNICVARSGEVFMAEDGRAAHKFIRVLTEKGEVYDFARNAASANELAGVCFSPDGRAMFVNLQKDGLTLVVTGPFRGTSASVDAGAAAPDAGATPDSGGASADAGTGGGSDDDGGCNVGASGSTGAAVGGAVAAAALTTAAVAARRGRGATHSGDNEQGNGEEA